MRVVEHPGSVRGVSVLEETLTIADHMENVTNIETFSIADTLQGRNYAQEDVKFILNDQIGIEWNLLTEEAKTTVDAKRLKQINSRLEELRDLSKQHEYTVTLRGIAEERYAAILAAAVEEYPREYDTYVNALTGQRVKEEIDNDDRDRYYTNLLWLEHFVKIVAPDGREQHEFSLEDIAAIRAYAPGASQKRIDTMIKTLRLVTEWQDQVINEDF